MSREVPRTIHEDLACIEDDMRTDYNLRPSQCSTSNRVVTGFQRIRAEIGSWYKRLNEYVIAQRLKDRVIITGEFSENGCLLRLQEPNQTEVRLFVEHIADTKTWRVHLAPATDLESRSTVEIDEKGEVSFLG